MWQKVAKFKGAEYFRKALYMGPGPWNSNSEQSTTHTTVL